MVRRDYLSTEDRTRFDSPPQLDSTQRLIFTDLSAWAEDYLAEIHTPANKVGFVLQLGYFRRGRLCGGHPLLYTRLVSIG